MVKCLSKLDDVFGALAAPPRRRILESLSRGDQCVTELAQPHRMSLPAVSKHLRVLEHAGLICRRAMAGCTISSSMPNRCRKPPNGSRITTNFGKARSIYWPTIWKQQLVGTVAPASSNQTTNKKGKS